MFENYFSCAFCHRPRPGDFRSGVVELVLYNPTAQACQATLTAYFTDKDPYTLPAVRVEPETNALVVFPDAAPEIFTDCGFWGARVDSTTPLMLNVVNGYRNQDPNRRVFSGGCTNFHGTKLNVEWRFPDGLWLEWMKHFDGDRTKAPFPFNESEHYYFLNPHDEDVRLEMTLQYQRLPHVKRHFTIPKQRLLVWDNFEQVEWVKGYCLRAQTDRPITASAVRFLYGLDGLEAWGQTVHCAMYGIPGPVPED